MRRYPGRCLQAGRRFYAPQVIPAEPATAAAPYQPRLTWWSHVWRDFLCVLLGLFVWVQVIEQQAEGSTPALFWLDLLLGVACMFLVHWRRRWPFAIAIITVAVSPLTSLGAGASALATVSAATYRVRWQLIVLAAVNFVATVGYYWIQPVNDSDPTWIVSLFTVVLVAALLAWGMFIGSRRELLWTLRQRAEAAEAERDLRATQARSSERTRIAREMHDVLAHRISQISMHAGALTYRDDLTADEMRASAAVIQEKAHEALDDLRSVLGVLRDESGTPLTGPQPTYEDIDTLVAEARADGMTIRYDARLPAGERMPDPIGRTVYRIVQEAITNARKHAPAATLRLRIEGSPNDGVDVEIGNATGFGPTRTPGAGLGLVGLTERTELAGGRLTHGVENGSFVLRAWLPWSP